MKYDSKICNLPSRMILGIAASPGLARGRALHCDCAFSVAVPRRQIGPDEAHKELARLDAAIETVERDLIRLQESVRLSIGGLEAEIFGAQIFMLRAVELRTAVLNNCIKERMNVEAAVESAIESLESAFNELKDPYFRERGTDLREVGKRLLNCLSSADQFMLPSGAEGCVLVSREASTSVVAQLKGRGIRGLILEHGGLTTHAAIIARALGIPMLVETSNAIQEIPTEAWVILDAIAGRVFINPDTDLSNRYNQLEADIRTHEGILKDQTNLPSNTLDSIEVILSANVGQSADAATAAKVKAIGTGLYRTEFVFQVQDHFPDEDEQYHFYRTTAEQLAPCTTAIRLLDVGSDKPLSYFPIPQEANPALGHRGIRLLLEHSSILQTQLRAILRLSSSAPVSILLPMITSVDEIHAIKDALKVQKREFAYKQFSFNPDIALGAMIETPSAAVLAEDIAKEVDFLSVGTNDLVQYLLCADRSSDTTAYDPLHPAVLRTLASLVNAASSAKKPISLCGEIAGDPLYTALLLGLGFRRLSVAPNRLLEVKYAIRSIRLVDAERLAKSVLSLNSIHEVRSHITEEWDARRPVSSPPVTQLQAESHD